MDQAELERLIAEHKAAVRSVLRGILRHVQDEEDCWQATCLVALNQLAKVHPAARRAWLVQVARRQAWLLLRRRAIDRDALRSLGEVAAIEPGDGTHGPEDHAEANEQRERLRLAIERLPAEQREVLRLKLMEGQTFQEIANQLKIPLGTALTRMRLALQKLSGQLKEPGEG